MKIFCGRCALAGVAVAATVVIAGLGTPSHAAQRYVKVDMGPYFPLGLNDKGYAVGDADGELFDGSHGNWKDIGRDLHGNHTQIGYRINNNNRIVGVGPNDDKGSVYSYTWHVGTNLATDSFHTITDSGWASAINDSDVSAGVGNVNGDPYSFFEVGSGPKIHFADAADGFLPIPVSINTSGLIVGPVYDFYYGDEWGFLYDTQSDTGVYLPDVPWAFILEASAINNQNTIIGTAIGEDGFAGFYISPTSPDYTWLSTPDGPGMPLAINDSNIIVGIGYDGSDYTPYIWKGTKRYNLNNLMPYGSTPQLEIPTAINKAGQIMVSANTSGLDLLFPGWYESFGSGAFVSGLNAESYLLVPQGDAPVVESIKQRGPAVPNTPIPFLLVLDEPAPAGGLTVNLSANSAVSLPSTVFVPAGSNKVPFDATSTGADGCDTIVGQLNNAWQSVKFDVNAPSI